MRNYHKNLLLCVAAFGISLLALPSQFTSAHTLRVDGQTGITLHIEPDDEPVAGEPSKLLISIQDKSNAFLRNASTCICEVSVKNGDEVVDSIDFAPDSEGSTAIDYTFENSGQNKVTISGQPSLGTEFEPFNVSFNYRVKGGVSTAAQTTAGDSQVQNPLKRYTPLVIIGVALFVVVLFFMPQRKTQSKAALKK